MSEMGISLCLLCAFTAFMSDKRIAGTSALLLSNWALNSLIAKIAGTPDPWAWFMAVDYVTAFVVLTIYFSPTMWQIIVAASFAVECVSHAAFGVSSQNEWAKYEYWYFLFYIACAQAVLVGIWGICDLLGRLLMPGSSLSHSDAMRKRNNVMEKD